MKQRKYETEFKIEAVKLAESQGVTKTAESLGLRPNLLYRWRNEYKENGQVAFVGKGNLKVEEAEMLKLRREVAVLKQERDILKKALAIFSKG